MTSSYCSFIIIVLLATATGVTSSGVHDKSGVYHITIDKGHPSVTLDAALVDPQVPRFWAAREPITIFWEVTSTPPGTSIKPHEFGLSPMSFTNTIDTSQLDSGDYIFLLTVHHINEYNRGYTYCRLTIREKKEDDNKPSVPHISFQEIIINHLMVYTYHYASLPRDIFRIALVLGQYMFDHTHQYKEILTERSKKKHLWSVASIDTSHYYVLEKNPDTPLTIATFKREMTLRSYFERSKVPYYDIIESFIILIVDIVDRLKQ